MYDYFYGHEAEAFSFFRIPKVLITKEEFKSLSAEAKILYGILLDKAGLSAKNDWLDEKGRVYIIYTIEQIMEDLGCGNKKAVQLLSELEKSGLAEKKRQGLGKPNLIYVKNFAGSGNTREKETGSGHFKKCQKDISGSVEMTSQEVSERHSNNTDHSNTENNKTDLYPRGQVSGPHGQKISCKGQITGSMAESGMKGRPEGRMDGETLRDQYEDYFRDVFEEGGLFEEVREDKMQTEILQGILDILVDACASTARMIRVAGDDKPLEVVRGRLMKLTAEHVRYVLQSLKENKTMVRNMRHYLLTTLFNAPSTMSSYRQVSANRKEEKPQRKYVRGEEELYWSGLDLK